MTSRDDREPDDPVAREIDALRGLGGRSTAPAPTHPPTHPDSPIDEVIARQNRRDQMRAIGAVVGGALALAAFGVLYLFRPHAGGDPTCTLKSTPSGATVVEQVHAPAQGTRGHAPEPRFVDGATLGKTPLSLPRSRWPDRIVLRAPGYAPKQVNAPIDGVACKDEDLALERR